MKYKWLNNRGNSSIILFFNGWGMDESVVKHLSPVGYDVAMFYDYTDLETDFTLDEKYIEVNVIAWSMGVMIAGITVPKISPVVKKSVAINGTIFPIDSKYGINPKIYDLTIKNFSPENADKFVKNMFTDSVSSSLLKNNNRKLEDKKKELIALKNYCGNKDYRYNKVIISNDDRIIPTNNQVKFWGIEPNLKSGHCPFFEFSKWSELL